MQRFSSVFAPLGALFFLSTTAPVRADTPAAGYTLSAAANPAFGSVVATLPSGDFVTWDGLRVDRWFADGTFAANLTSFPSIAFPSFIVCTPDDAFVVIGESSTGKLHTVALDGSGRAFLAKLNFNYDAAFSPGGDLYVSAAHCGFSCGNQISRVILATGDRQRVAVLDGPSGPVAFDTAGNLYYATQSPQFPPPPGSTDVLYWTPAQHQGPSVLSELDAALYSGGFDGGTDLAFDPVASRMYMSVNDFSQGLFHLLRVETTASLSPEVFRADQSVANLQFLNDGGAASFDPYQPSDGSYLRCATTDFFSASNLITVRPQRPALTVTGPGTQGPGPFTFSLAGAVPGGAATLVFAPQATFTPLEVPHSIAGILLHTGLNLSQVQRLPLLLSTDGAGALSVTFQNPGGLEGQYAYQMWIREGDGALVGSSTSVLF